MGLVDRLNNPDYHILALLIGTSDGAGLYRTNGSMNSNSPTSHLSEEIISGIESVWASLPSGTGHHLRPLGLGNDVKTVTAFYENCTLLHAYMSPLVVTILATTDANIGVIRAIFPNLFELLESTRQTLIDATERIRSRMK